MSNTVTQHKITSAIKPHYRFKSLTILLCFALLLIPISFKSDYVSGLLVQALLLGIVALLTDIIWGYAGILSFASAGMFGLGAYLLGGTFVHASSSPQNAIIAISAAGVGAAAVSGIIGWLAFYSRIRLSGFYIAVITLGLSILFGQVIVYGGALTGASNGLSGFKTLELSNDSWLIYAVILLLLSVVVGFKVVRSDFGLVLRAIRDNENRCRYLGIKTPKTKTIVFAASNAIIAIVGSIYAMYTTVVSPSLVSMVAATNILIWVILGGRGTLIGPAIAATVITVITPYLSVNFPLYWQGFLGVAFVFVVVFLPEGIVPYLVRLAKMSILRSPGPRDAPADTLETESGNLIYERLDSNAEVRQHEGLLLQLSGVSKSFGSFSAVSDVSFDVAPGELVSIVGPNGAGKTSLLRCIADGYERTSGTIHVDGVSIEQRAPEVVAALGVGRKFQSPSVFGTLTVGDCLQVASWRGGSPSYWKRSQEVFLSDGAAEVVESLGLQEVWDMPAQDISHGQRQALEIAMVLALEPRVVLLDEPTAGLTNSERERVGIVLQRLVASQRLTILLIEHDFEFVKLISSRIIVLVGGKLVADGSVEAVASSEAVQKAYLGRTYEEAMA